MDLLSQVYGEPDPTPESNSIPSLQLVNLTPSIDEAMTKDRFISTGTRELYFNPTYQELAKPAPGAIAPWSNQSVVVGGKNVLNGYVEDAYINDSLFNSQQQSFQNRGYAVNPDDNSIIGNVDNYEEPVRRKRKRPKGKARSSHKDPSNVEGFMGPWFNAHEEKIKEYNREHGIGETDVPTVDNKPETDDQTEDQENMKADEPEITVVAENEEDDLPHKKSKLMFEPSSIQHVHVERDFKGRTWVDPPSEMKKDKPHDCYAPKKLIYTWSGHTKGVSAIRFLPGYGNLLLSASMDNTIKIWEVYGRRRCMQTYNAHDKGVRDICFSNDGHRFISCGYDKFMRLWDTETGQCLQSYTGYKIPFCLKFNPIDQNMFLSGHRDKRIMQWDTRSGAVVHSYDRHLGAVNTITFVDEGTRFVSTSDDKSIRVWEWGNPMEIKFISDPSMYSIPAASLSKNEKWLLCQSSDNKILVYSTKDRFRLNRKKKFVGHLTAGSTCDVVSSPDGRYILSGSTTGDMYIWDWKSCSLIKKQAAHDDVMTGAQWHPNEPSRVATCSWDGSIKYWD